MDLDLLKEMFPYEKWREGQAGVIKDILMTKALDKSKKYFVVRAPTGSGKSAIALTLARAVNEVWGSAKNSGTSRGYLCSYTTQGVHPEVVGGIEPLYEEVQKSIIVTPKKALQDQYMRDFSGEEGMVVYKGRDNYQCGATGRCAGNCPVKNKTTMRKRPDDVPEGWDKKFTCMTHEDSAHCGYRTMLMDALYRKEITVCNLHTFKAYLMLSPMYAGLADSLIVENRALIVDECHLLPEFLIDLFSTTIVWDSVYRDLEEFSEEYTPPQQPAGPSASHNNLLFFGPDGLEAGVRAAAVCELKRLVDSLGTHAGTRNYKEIVKLRVMFQDLLTILSYLQNAFNNMEITKKVFEYAHKVSVIRTALADISNLEYLIRRHENTHLVEQAVAEEGVEVTLGELEIPEGTLSQFFDMECEQGYKGFKLTVGCKSPAYGFHRMTSKFDPVILMSGTVMPDQIKKGLGLAEKKTHVHTVRAETQIDVRPFIYLGDYSSSLGWKNKESGIKVAAKRVANVMRFHDNWRGLIHTHSKWFSENLRKHLRKMLPADQFRRIIWHDGGPKEILLEQFMDAGPDAVIASPSLVEGFDGKGDIARWQCILKVPYTPRNDPYTASRLAEGVSGEIWYTSQIVNTLAQAYGRVNRGQGDLGVTYMIDGAFTYFMKNLQKYKILEDLPEMFRDALGHLNDFIYVHEKGKWFQFPVRAGGKRARNADDVIRPMSLLGG